MSTDAKTCQPDTTRRKRKSEKAKAKTDIITEPSGSFPLFVVKPNEFNYNDSASPYIHATTKSGLALEQSLIPPSPVCAFEDGVLIDFNSGCRVSIPASLDNSEYRVKFIDADRNLCIYDSVVPCGMTACSSKKYYINYRVEIYKNKSNEPFIVHQMDLKDKLVVIFCNGGGLGDGIAWFSNIDKFIKKHKCRTIVVLDDFLIPVFESQYPHIRFISKHEVSTYKPYASYFIGLYFNSDTDFQPIDFRLTGLHKVSAYILDVDREEITPPLVNLEYPRKIKEKYVVISTQSTTRSKYWNNPHGWYDVIKFLKASGYRVICIDKDAISVNGIHSSQIPNGCEDFTGNLPLQERINIIKDADFFIGLSSGLSWLAWCCKVPVVLISGFTEDYNEFYTPYRCSISAVCHGCWNDQKENFDHYDFMYCPKNKNTQREFECTRHITSYQVIETIKRIPSFRDSE